MTKDVCDYSLCTNSYDEQQLMECSICGDAVYCSKECQTESWKHEGHKYSCAKKIVPRRVVDSLVIEDIQSAIDEANPGDVIVLKEGTYHWENKKLGKDALTISKPIRIWGPQLKQKEVLLPCNLEIDDKLSIKGSVTVANITLMGPIKVQSNAYDAITFSSVKAEQTNQTGDGTMVHIMRNGKCLFFNCELVGGDEALYIDGIDDLSHSKESNENRVHIKSTLIRNGDKRGICADDKFILEKSIIRDNGWYGIRSNLGWTDKGGNDWQRNPSKPNQTPTSGNGMFDGLSYPVSFNSSGGMSLGTGMTGDMMFPGFGQSASRR